MVSGYTHSRRWRQPAQDTDTVKPLRIATYNIHKAKGMDRRTSVERIGRVLEEVGADIVGLQEVYAAQAGELGASLGYHVTMGEARQHAGAGYGNATLTRVAARRSEYVAVTVPGREERCVLRTDVPYGHHVLHIFNAHLGVSFFERRKQAQRLFEADLLRAVDMEGARVVLGDFNEWTRGLVTRLLHEEFREADILRHLPRRRVYPMALPLLGLDHIYLDSHLAVKHAYFHISLLSLVASDHVPLVADVELARVRMQPHG
jgi:endonuclease/exonuclease/phosphatase family metal-dependent hydrolase